MKFFTGTVYSKALAIFLAAALALLGAVAGLTQLIILREFNQSEQREMKTMLQRFSYFMDRETKPLEAALGEWMQSPGVRKYASKGQAVLPEKISAIGLKELDADFVAIFSSKGEPLIWIAADKRYQQPTPVFLKEVVTAASAVSGNQKEINTGYALFEHDLCVLSIGSLPAESGAGYILGGRVFRKGAWGFLEGLFSATIQFEPFTGTVVSESSNPEIVDLLNSRETVVDESSESQMVGYSLIKSFEGGPLGAIKISQPRPLRQEGLHAIQIFLSGISLAGGALVLVVWFLLDRTILARIKDLTQKLDAEKRSGRLPVRMNFRGEDELGTLARSIEDLAGLLQSTQNLYRAVLEDQTELICRFDAEYRLTFANAIFQRMFGIEENSLTSRQLQGFLPEAAWEAFRNHFEKLLPENSLTSYSHEIRLGTPASPRWFRSTLRRIFDAGGVSTGGQWVLAEITPQVEAQRKMIESERRFRRIFESASDGLLLVEGESLVISDVNPALCRMLMLAGSEVLGRRLNEIAVFAPCVEIVENYRMSGRDPSSRSECRLRRADDMSLFVELRCGRYDVDGVEFVQMTFSNISERVLGEQELRRLSAKLLRLQDDERRRIARELHDSTAQNLSALEMNMSLLEPLVGSSNPRAARIVAETRAIAGECSKELRNISYLLHPPLIDEVGLAFAVRWFADGFSKRTGIETAVEIDEGFPRLGNDLEMPLFRVVQEAMTNIYRHSGADRAWIKLCYQARAVTMEIRDNGRGFKEGSIIDSETGREYKGGVGLAGMKERLANVGGKLEIESSPWGATVSIRLFLNPGVADDLEPAAENSIRTFPLVSEP